MTGVVPAERPPNPSGAASPPEHGGGPKDRVVALDVVRGSAVVVLFLAMHPGPRGAFPAQFQHPEWHGLSFVDLFFPVFLFAVGASIPFSSKSDRARSVVGRAVRLAAIGVALSVVTAGELVLPNDLTGVLQHIAVAYLVGWLILRLPRAAQIAVFVGILAAVWLAYVVFADGPDPWSMSGGLAHRTNSWLFGTFRSEGLPQAVVSSCNVLAGAWCAQLVRSGRTPRSMAAWAAVGAAVLLAAGLVVAGWVPVNKRLWTPSFALVSAAFSVALFAACSWVLEVRRWRGWSRPLVELGSNAMAAYVFVILSLGFIPRFRDPLDRALDGVPPAVVTWGWAFAWLLVGWLASRTLHRRGLFLKV